MSGRYTISTIVPSAKTADAVGTICFLLGWSQLSTHPAYENLCKIEGEGLCQLAGSAKTINYGVVVAIAFSDLRCTVGEARPLVSVEIFKSRREPIRSQSGLYRKASGQSAGLRLRPTRIWRAGSDRLFPKPMQRQCGSRLRNPERRQQMSARPCSERQTAAGRGGEHRGQSRAPLRTGGLSTPSSQRPRR